MRRNVINILSFDFASFSGYHNAIGTLSIIHFIKYGDLDAMVSNDVTLYKIVFYEIMSTFKRDPTLFGTAV